MKHLLPYFALGLSAFMAGLIVSLATAHWIEQALWQRTLTELGNFKFDAELAAQINLANIKHAESGDVDSVIRMNCMGLRSALKVFNASDFPAGRQAEVQAFSDQARDAVARLQASGQCGLPFHKKTG